MTEHMVKFFRLLVNPARLFRAIAARCTHVRKFNHFRICLPNEISRRFEVFSDTSYEIEEWESLWTFGKPGSTFLDIGSNIGILTVAMSRIAGSKGTVIACEPHPHIYPLLLEVIRKNKCRNTIAMPTLILDQCTASRFYISPLGDFGVRSSAVAQDPGSHEVILPAVTLDTLMTVKAVDYIKIDAEGAEYKILLGAEKTLKRSRPVIQVEIHGQYMPQDGASVPKLFELMRDRSYASVNVVTWEEVNADEFLKCTHCHVPDAFTNSDLAYAGYGHVVFIPSERRDLLENLKPRACRKCQ